MKELVIALSVCTALLISGCSAARKVGDSFTTAGKATATGAVTAGRAVGGAGEAVGKTVTKPFANNKED